MPKWRFVDDPSEGRDWASNQSSVNVHIEFVHEGPVRPGLYRVAVASPAWIQAQLDDLESRATTAALLTTTLVVQGDSIEELRLAIAEALAVIPVWRFAVLCP